MIELILLCTRIKDRVCLVPVDALGEGELFKNVGKEIKIKPTKPRNPKFHRLFFGMIGVVFEHQEQYPTLEGMLDAIKIAVGHCDKIIGIDKKTYFIPRSISFAKMDQESFEQFYNRAFNLVITAILPNIGKDYLEQEIFTMCGLLGPEDCRR